MTNDIKNSIVDRPDDKHGEGLNAKQGGNDGDAMTKTEGLMKVGPGPVQQDSASYLTQDCVLVIIMASSIVDKETTIKSFEETHGFNVLGQHTLQLTPTQADILYAYDAKETKPHYQQLYEGWKTSSLSDPVQVLILAKENAVVSFQALVNLQNSTKKKDRMMDPLSVYASMNQDNVKRDIMLLLGTSNNQGDSVSSPAMNDVIDDTVTQIPFETMSGSMQMPILMANSQFQQSENNNMVKSTSDTENNNNNNNKKKDQSTLSTTSALAIPELSSTIVTHTGMIPEKEVVTDDALPLNKTENGDQFLSESDIKADSHEYTVGVITKDIGTESISKPPSPSRTTDANNINSITKDGSKMETNGSSSSSTDGANNSSKMETNSSSKVETSSNIKSGPTPVRLTQSPTSIDGGQQAKLNKKPTTNQRSRDNMQITKKKQSTDTAAKPTTRMVTISGIKTNKTASPPHPPLKSMFRTPTTTPAITATRPTTQTTNKIQPSIASGEPKKKTLRVPRVATLTKPASAPKEENDKPQPTQKKKISSSAIARLSAPTASSARRQQGASTTNSIPATPTITKGHSVTATFRLEQRKTRPSAEKPERLVKPLATRKTRPTTAGTTNNDKKKDTTRKVVAKKDVVDQDLPAIIDTTERVVEDTAIPSPVQVEEKKEMDVTKTEPRSPAESSTTSSRPQTPEQTQQTTATTTDNAKPSLVTLNTTTASNKTPYQKPPAARGNVKDLLSRFM
ncbi:hypothetical protein BC941DRAFT_419399 [Chlamydoabsidia padenii]|nr:hypothetical protein BC941DRAFT_419399 [Chlamydoabsidia padenii]